VNPASSTPSPAGALAAATAATASATASAVAAPAARLESIDVLRGLVIALMALDHTRDFFHYGVFQNWDPLDLSRTTPALFLTRWITHFCAPIFIFLAGTGASLSTTRGRSKGSLSWFLLTRGLWLIFLEVTFIRCLGWKYSFALNSVALIVIWAIGVSMIVLAGLVHLPRPVIAAFGLILIFGHNALDDISPSAWGSWANVWRILHAGGSFPAGAGVTIIAGYPLIPWIGVMAVGYAFGGVRELEPNHRRNLMFALGLGAIALFILFRGFNLYGNTPGWKEQGTPLNTLFAILDCRKYPPSLSYLLMTLGPALIVLAWLDRGTPVWLRPALVFGRVPLFFYLLHLPLIHGLSVLVHRLRFTDVGWLFDMPGARPPPGAGFSLAGTYLAWIIVLLILYPVCRWFADLKRRRRDPWLSYL
jgi:uncharacterized membrane protein